MTTGYVGPDAMPIAPVGAPEAWDIEADVVVVGTGMGGPTASTVASQAGFKTVIVEKNPFIGAAVPTPGVSQFCTTSTDAMASPSMVTRTYRSLIPWP